MAQLHKLTQGAEAEMRTLLFELRPENLMHTKLEELLQQLCQATEARKRIAVSVITKRDEEQLLPENVHVAVYRIAQESFNNFVKHGKTKLARVRLIRSRNYVELVIVDSGQGFDTKAISSGFGLTSMRERAESIDASLQIQSIVGMGTRVKLIWRGKQE